MDMKDKHMTNVDNKCISCKGDAVEFVDTLAKKEYTLSGLCQTCQDGVFKMSHHMNDLAYEQRQDLYWDTYDDLIAKGYDAGVAEDMALAIVERDIEKKGDN